MDPPPVQYTKTSDGHSIAYTVCGQGQPLVFVGPVLGGMAHMWRFFGDWMEGLARRFQLVQFDLRGHGMSDRGLTEDFDGDDATLQAVLDRLHLKQFVLFGLSGVGHVAIKFAASYPEKVEALVLAGTTISVSMPSFWGGVGAENWDFFLWSLVPRSLPPEQARLWFDGLKDSTAYVDWQVRGRIARESNVRDYLPRLAVPTLLLYSRGLTVSSLEEAARLASMVPGGLLVTIEGESALGDATESIAAIERFLMEQGTGRATPPLPSHGLSARELDVLLIAAGRSNQQIADELVISRNTARKHVANIFGKTGVSNRVGASAYARDHGFV